MTTRSLSATMTLAAASLALASTAGIAGNDPAPGWGMAIAARVIGEKCVGALKSTEIADLNTYITTEFQKTVETSGKGTVWWSDLRDKLEQSYVEKYSDTANCTEDAREQAEDMVEDVRDTFEERSQK